VGRIVVGGSVFLTGAQVCCRFAVHPRNYNYPFTVFAILLSQCVVNMAVMASVFFNETGVRVGSLTPPVTAVLVPIRYTWIAL